MGVNIIDQDYTPKISHCKSECYDTLEQSDCDVKVIPVL